MEENYRQVSQVDAAVARPLADSLVNPSILGIGKPAGITAAYLGQKVQKSGRSTGVTSGIVTVLDATVDVGFGLGRKARLFGQIVTGKMADPGDSGSLLVDGAKKAVGLLFAGGPLVTLYNPIQAVLKALKVKMHGQKDEDESEEVQLPADLLQLCRAKEDELLSLPNVVGVGIGYKKTGGRSTDKLSIVVLVEKKVQKQRLSPDQRVPDKIEGVPTDVVESGPLEAGCFGLWPRRQQNRLERLRPVRPGVSIGHFRVSAGTLGAVVYDLDSGVPLLLSNNHVLANATDGNDNLSAPGDAVLQPGYMDGGRVPEDTIAVLERFVPLKFL